MYSIFPVLQTTNNMVGRAVAIFAMVASLVASVLLFYIVYRNLKNAAREEDDE